MNKPPTTEIKNEAWLITGGNMGNRLHYLEAAKAQIAQHCGTIIKASPVFETAAWGKTGQASFYNQCLVLHTGHDARSLLNCLLQIELDLGRERLERYGPRTIDIDILLFNDDIINEPGLHVPHPQLAHRRFVLTCMAAIDGGRIHPVLNEPVATLLASCPDPLEVHKIP